MLFESRAEMYEAVKGESDGGVRQATESDYDNWV